MVSGNFANRVRQVLSRRDNSGLTIHAESVGGTHIAYQKSLDEDIGPIINDALEKAGRDGIVEVEAKRYTQADGIPLETTIQTQAEGQTIDFNGSDLQFAAGASGNMVEIRHDSCKVKNGTLEGRRDNTSVQSCLTNTTDVNDISIEDIKVSGASDALLLDGVEDSDIRNTGSIQAGDDVDKSIVLRDCEDITILNAKTKAFNDDAVELQNCNAIVTRAVGVVPESGTSASRGIHMLGCRDCVIGGVIDANGEVDVGVRDEAFDVGGANERFSTANVIDMVITGVNDIGFHVSDAEKERVRGYVDGEKPTGRTTQAFLVDAPNGLANPQHDIDVSGITLTRITDTDQTGVNVGMRLGGHFSKISETSTIGAGGNSVVDFNFGQAVPSPVVETNGDTTVQFTSQGNQTTTNASGQVSVDFSDEYALNTKPNLSVTLEQAGQWYVDSFSTNGNGKYDGVTIQVTDSGGTAVGNGVQTNLKIIGT